MPLARTASPGCRLGRSRRDGAHVRGFSRPIGYIGNTSRRDPKRSSYIVHRTLLVDVVVDGRTCLLKVRVTQATCTKCRHWEFGIDGGSFLAVRRILRTYSQPRRIESLEQVLGTLRTLGSSAVIRNHTNDEHLTSSLSCLPAWKIAKVCIMYVCTHNSSRARRNQHVIGGRIRW